MANSVHSMNVPSGAPTKIKRSLARRCTKLSAAPLAVAVDPVLVLFNSWQVIEAAVIRVDALHAAAKAACGSARQSDPNYPECRRLLEESDRLCDQVTDVVLRIMETPATSLAGIVGKMRIVLREWPTIPAEECELHEKLAIACMTDAVRLLGGASTLDDNANADMAAAA
jgi:hypothetical protein